MNATDSPILRYGLIILFSVITLVSFYISIFNFKTIDDQGKTTYNISRSIGFFISFLFSLYLVVNLVLNKSIDLKYIKELGDNISNIGRNVTTFSTN